MPYDGNGNFSPPAGDFPAVAGTTILASKFNSVITDLASSGLSSVITRDGQGVPIADISWGNRKLINLADPTQPQDAANYRWVLSQLATIPADTNFNGKSITGLLNLTMTGNATVGGNLNVTGTSTLSGNVTANGNITLAATKRVTADLMTVTTPPAVGTDVVNKSALDAATGQVNLGAKILYVSGPTTLVGSGYTVLADTSGGGYTITLPLQTIAAYPTVQTSQPQIGFEDVKGTWTNNNLIIAPATGQTLMAGLGAVNETLVCDVSYDAFVLGWTNQDWRFL